jgi:hypothetical protein
MKKVLLFSVFVIIGQFLFGNPNHKNSNGRSAGPDTAGTSLQILVTQVGAIKCRGGLASINVAASGGTAPYCGTGTMTRTAGTWTFTIMDVTGVMASASITVTEPEQLVANITATPITCVDGTSTITVTATGGVAPYTGTGTFTRTAGTYTFTVSDANGCTANANVVLGNAQTVQPIITIGQVVSPGNAVRINATLPTETQTTTMSAVAYPNPSQTGFELKVSSNSNKNVTVLVYDVHGELKSQAVVAPRNRYMFGASLMPGIYFVNVLQGDASKSIRIVKM